MTDNPLGHRWHPTGDDPPRFWHRIDDYQPSTATAGLPNRTGAQFWLPHGVYLDPNEQPWQNTSIAVSGRGWLTIQEARGLAAALLSAAARAGGVFPGYELTDEQVAEIRRANWPDTEERAPASGTDGT